MLIFKHFRRCASSSFWTRKFFTFLLIVSPYFYGNWASFASIDLHVHLTMKEGLGFLYHGDFHSPPKAVSFDSKYSSKITAFSLKNTRDPNILVASIYTHPFFSGDQRDSAKQQIKQIQSFSNQNPSWAIVKTPKELTQALFENKKAIILSIEGASGILENEEDLELFIDQLGVRIVTPMHFLNDEFGGAAFLRGPYRLLNPIALINTYLHGPSTTPYPLNLKGLSTKGHWLIDALIKRRVWVDFTHASDLAQREMAKKYKALNLPILYTHTVLRSYFQAERALSLEQLSWTKETQGVIGVLPSSDYLKGTPGDHPYHQLLQQIREISEEARLPALYFGSDFNAPLTHLPPGSNTHTSIDQTGYWNYHHESSLLNALSKSDVGALFNEKTALRHFLEAWRKIRAPLH